MLYLVLASLLLLHTEWTVVRSTSFCTITKSNIANRIVITLTPPPTSSRKNLLQSKRFGNNNFIHDIVFCPNIAFCATSTDGQVQDDDHFCSRLCDRGFRVHICLPATDLLLNASITTTSKATETFKSLTKSTIRKTQFYRSNIDCVDKNNDNNKKDDKMRFFKSVALHLNLRMPNTAIIAQEVSVPSLLRYLSDNVSRKSELPAAVVLTDPPPLIPLYSNADRTRLLNDRFPIQLKNIIDKYA